MIVFFYGCCCCCFHYFALLMYFLTSHVHNSVSCKISYEWRLHTHQHTHQHTENFCSKVKVESLLSRFLVIFLLQPLPVCMCLWVCVCVFVYFMQGKSFVKKRTKNFSLFAVDKPKVTSICISNFFGQLARAKTLELEILYIEDDIPCRCLRSTHTHTLRHTEISYAVWVANFIYFSEKTLETLYK